MLNKASTIDKSKHVTHVHQDHHPNTKRSHDVNDNNNDNNNNESNNQISTQKTNSMKKQQQREPRYTGGQFKKFAGKVIEWIRKSLALGRNEVFNFIIPIIHYDFW